MHQLGKSGDPAQRDRVTALTVPLVDRLILACAKAHGLDVGRDGTEFDQIAKLDA